MPADVRASVWHDVGMARLTCAAESRQVLIENGATASAVTWPVRVRRWWEDRRDRARSPRRHGDPAPEPTELWERVERAFRLMDVADERPDPALTRRIASALLDEVLARIETVDDAEERRALERAVRIVRRELVPAGQAP